MKRWLLAIWYKIMRKYANHQIKELEHDLQSIDYENKIFRGLFHIFLLLWIVEKMPKITIAYKTHAELILKIWLNENTFIYLPTTNYMGIVENIIKAKREYETIESADSSIINIKENIDKAHKFMLKSVLDRFDR